MSGDVQPRKRKDKKRKRDSLDRRSEGEIFTKLNVQDDEDIKESHHGVHATKMGRDDVHLHIQGDHETGGHWCAKIFFFSLLAILAGIVGLIILENRGLSDLDTPLSESRFSEYFDGWVDEHRQFHDDHHEAKTDLENHGDDAGPFEEEDDHSENNENSNEDNENQSEEIITNSQNEDISHQNEDDEVDERINEDEDEEGDDDDEDDNANDEQIEDEIRNKNDKLTREKREAEINDVDDDEGFEDDGTLNSEENESRSIDTNGNDVDDSMGIDIPFEEDDDDFDEDSLEQVVDNDAGEESHLRRKAEEEELAAKAAEPQESDDVDSAPIGVKVAVGLALAFVARLVLVKRKPTKDDELLETVQVKRRLTMISVDDDIPVENPEIIDEEGIDECAEEEWEEEEDELHYSEEAEEDDVIQVEKFAPDTFEQLNTMYRSKSLHNQKIDEHQSEVQPDNTTGANLRSIVQKQGAGEITINNFVETSDNWYDEKSEPICGKTETIIDEPENEGEFEEEELEGEEICSGSEEDADEEISDVDDEDLLRRLEEKYGKLPEKRYNSDDDVEDSTWTKLRGPQSYDQDDGNFHDEIYRANEELLNDNLRSALKIYESLILQDPEHITALYGKAIALDRLSEKYKNNQMLTDTIDAYHALINLDKKVDDEMFRYAAERCLNRMRFKGMLAQAVPVHRKLMRRFGDDPQVRNELAVTYLLQNRYEEAKYILHHTLIRWRNDGFAQVHYGFILKTHDNDLKAAIALLREGIASGANGTQDGRFYFALGDALYRQGEKEDAIRVYMKGSELKIFPSLYQRSLYNINGLKAQPFWTVEETTYDKEFANIKRNWELIRDEGMSVINFEGYFKDEVENLRDSGEWKQLDLFVRGKRVERNCLKTPLTCKIIETFTAARFCKRGQVKFSVIHPGTHVWPHCGPTNCRLRAHLGLVVPFGAKLRVATEERVWKAGEWLIFDDSFEHEVWHNGTGLRLVLIVDIWHPELTELQRDSLSPM